MICVILLLLLLQFQWVYNFQCEIRKGGIFLDCKSSRETFCPKEMFRGGMLMQIPLLGSLPHFQVNSTILFYFLILLTLSSDSSNLFSLQTKFPVKHMS